MSPICKNCMYCTTNWWCEADSQVIVRDTDKPSSSHFSTSPQCAVRLIESGSMP
jgi:hypothetical protein